MNAQTSSELSTSTFGNEDQLPRVPLPTLADSCARFLDWCAPLLTPEQLARTAAAVAEFQAPGGPGPVLHAALVDYAADPRVGSWLDTFWPYRYLGRRDRIALNANFFFLFQDSGADQVTRAATLITASVLFKRQLDAELIPPVIQRGRPLSMSQLRYLFSATRIPGARQDTVRVPYTPDWPGPSQARHIVVFHRGGMYRLDVLAPDGTGYAVEDLVAGLREIQKLGAGAGAPDTAVGHLTTKARADWAASRAALIDGHPDNAAALDTVETALFCLALEHEQPAGTLATCDQLLHGDSGNRWFDKALTFIVFPDGRAGINVEHCGLDGTTVLTFVDAVLTTPPPADPPLGPPPVEPVRFTLDATLRADIAAAAAAFAQYAADTATTIVDFPDFGADTAKTLKISPDAFVQLAYQLAHYRAKGHLGATYESIATRQYRNGRTEAMRVVTPEIVEFVAIMNDPAADCPARLAALRTAAEAHVRRAKQCQQGQAPEQHLWELLLIQHRRGAELGVTDEPALYHSPGWLIMRDDYLSTSSAPSQHIQYFGFGSTSSRCIGVAYLLLPDRFHLYLSTPRPVAAQLDAFAGHLRDVVGELRELLAG